MFKRINFVSQSNKPLQIPLMAHWFLLQFLILITPNFIKILDSSDADVLLNFKRSLSNAGALYNWNQSVNPCNGWIGLRCNRDGTIDKLLLVNMGLSGFIDIDSLFQLQKLRTLSFNNNSFVGQIPQVKKLTSLRSLDLSSNGFVGEISGDGFDGMNSLIQLYLGNNGFSGEIPNSLVGLKKLTKLSLGGNRFGGKIPLFTQNFVLFDVADNNLDGPIPASLANIDPNNLRGNSGLCGKPLSPCKRSTKKKKLIIICVIIGSLLALIAILAYTYTHRRRSRPPKSKQTQVHKAETNKIINTKNSKKQTKIQSPPIKRIEAGKLHFVRNGYKFDLNDLLRASAEILGSGSFGSSFKAVLLNGSDMVVKRFKEMNNVGKEEFYEHMKKLGRLSHPNLLPLLAFYYRKEEKLLVSEFVANGSLASQLHVKRTPGERGLDWQTRLKIIKGVARALACLRKEFPEQTLYHGHLKSSNVLLNEDYEPLLTDYALVPVVNRAHAQQVMVAYKSPEYTQHERTTKKTDVWSLGILILEVLTGKLPASFLCPSKGAVVSKDLASWVDLVVREEWTGDVFDKEMRVTKNVEGEMIKLLKIGICCCEWSLERRWDLKEAVMKIEELKAFSNDNNDTSSFATEDDKNSSYTATAHQTNNPFSVSTSQIE